MAPYVVIDHGDHLVMVSAQYPLLMENRSVCHLIGGVWTQSECRHPENATDGVV